MKLNDIGYTIDSSEDIFEKLLELHAQRHPQFIIKKDDVYNLQGEYVVDNTILPEGLGFRVIKFSDVDYGQRFILQMRVSSRYELDSVKVQSPNNVGLYLLYSTAHPAKEKDYRGRAIFGAEWLAGKIDYD